MSKFKVGDRVTSIFYTDLGKNRKGVIIQKSQRIPDCWNINWDDGNRGDCMEGEYENYHEINLELVEEECKGYPVTEANIQETINNLKAAINPYGMYQVGVDFALIDYKPKQTIMSKITTFAKNLVLSADEKLLRKYGLHDECGNHTDEAGELVITKLVKENEAYLIELAKGMEAEEAKK